MSWRLLREWRSKQRPFTYRAVALLRRKGRRTKFSEHSRALLESSDRFGARMREWPVIDRRATVALPRLATTH